MEEKEKKIKVEQINIYTNMCKACGICVNFCPTKTLISDKFGYPVVDKLEDCTGCELCVVRCPDLAIEIIKKIEKEKVK